jgi:hypothetical protein
MFRFFFLSFLLAFQLWTVHDAKAQCTSPTAGAGAKDWFSASSTYKFCIGTSWVAVTEASDLTSCTTAGQWEYDSSATAFKQCRAGTWRKIGCSGGTSGLPTGCYDTWTANDSNRVWWAVASSSDGTKLVATVQNGQIYTSTDSGATWTARASTLQWAGVASSSDGTKLVAVAPTDKIYTSTDSGVNWTARNSNRTWISVASSSDGTKLAATVNSGQIYTSTDSGVNWTARDSSRAWRGIASSSDGTKLAAVVSGGQIYTSTDSGVNWTARDSNRSWLEIKSSADGTKLAAAVSGGQIYTSTDSGATWTARESSRNWQGLAMSSDGSVIAGLVYNGQIYISIDGGVTWTATETSRKWAAGAMSADGKKMVAPVDGGKIYTSTCSSLTGSLTRTQRATTASGSGTANLTSASFTPSNNSLLVAVAGGVTDGSFAPSVTVSGGSLTWTRRAQVSNASNGYPDWYSYVEMWTAPVTTGASMTVTHANTKSVDGKYLAVYEYTGYDTSSPIGATATGSRDDATGAWTITLSSSPASNSEIISSVALDNWDGGGAANITNGTGWTETYKNGSVGSETQGQVQVLSSPSSTSVTWNLVDAADASGTGENAAAAAIEIKAASSGGGGSCSTSLGSCSTAGQLEYTGGKMRYCNGTNWYAIAE